MALSPILDIAIGLMLIYLILSLLASELQELLATVLQWRADHLKKSIEILLSGGEKSSLNPGTNPVTADMMKAKLLSDRLYSDPLINSLNQQAKGIFSEGFRRVFRTISQGFKLTSSTFAQRTSAPSYIPAKNFAASLISTLHIPDMVHLVSARRLHQFKTKLLTDIRRTLQFSTTNPTVAEYFDRFSQQLEAIVVDYQEEKFSLDVTINRMARLLDHFITAVDRQTNLPEIADLKSLSNEKFGQVSDRDILITALIPTSREVVQSLRYKAGVYREIQDALSELKSADDPTRKGIEGVLNHLPTSVQVSLAALAKQAQQKNQSIRDDLSSFQTQVERWFNDSQERAAGVYRRNARGVAILIGIFMAVAANADTFYIVDRLSKDSLLRAAVTQAATEVVSQNQTNITSQSVRAQIDPILQDIDQPLGWSEKQWRQQYFSYLGCDPLARPVNRSTNPANTANFANPANLSRPATPIDPTNQACTIPDDAIGRAWFWLSLWLRIMLGWLLTGIAIAMGAPFWFDLLGKIVRVKNSGQPSRAD